MEVDSIAHYGSNEKASIWLRSSKRKHFDAHIGNEEAPLPVYSRKMVLRNIPAKDAEMIGLGNKEVLDQYICQNPKDANELIVLAEAQILVRRAGKVHYLAPILGKVVKENLDPRHNKLPIVE